MDYVIRSSKQMNDFIKSQNPKSVREEVGLQIAFTKAEIDKKKKAIFDLQEELEYLEESLGAFEDNLSSLDQSYELVIKKA